MKLQNGLTMALGMALALFFSSQFAFAKGKKAEVKKAEAKMMTACKKDYPDAVKGKTFKQVAEWVEAEERGASAEQFKKSDCYNIHEDWEKVAENQEAGEENEHKN